MFHAKEKMFERNVRKVKAGMYKNRAKGKNGKVLEEEGNKIMR